MFSNSLDARLVLVLRKVRIEERRLFLLNGESHGEARADAECACSRNVATHELAQLSTNRESQASPTGPPRAGGIDLFKLVKDRG